MKHVIVVSLALLLGASAHGMELNLDDQLIEAARDGVYDKVVYCLDEGANPKAEYSILEGATALLSAASNGHASIVELLIKRKADVNTPGSSFCMMGCSPLNFACEGGHLSTVQLLLDNGANPKWVNDLFHTPLHNALANGHVAIADLLLQKGAPVNPEMPISDRATLSQGAFKFSSTSRIFGSPISIAVELCRADMVELLLKFGADVLTRNANLLANAYAHGDKQIIEFLKKAGAVITVVAPRLVLQACRAGALDGVRCLIQTGVCLECRDDVYDATPVLWAANGAHVDICKQLVFAGARLDVKNNKLLTALDCARCMHNKELVRFARYCLKYQNPLWIEECTKLLQRVINYRDIIDLLEYYGKNPLPLQQQAVILLRKQLKQGLLKKSDLSEAPICKENGFEEVVVDVTKALEKDAPVQTDLSEKKE